MDGWPGTIVSIDKKNECGIIVLDRHPSGIEFVKFSDGDLWPSLFPLTSGNRVKVLVRYVDATGVGPDKESGGLAERVELHPDQTPHISHRKKKDSGDCLADSWPAEPGTICDINRDGSGFILADRKWNDEPLRIPFFWNRGGLHGGGVVGDRVSFIVERREAREMKRIEC